MSWHNRLCVEMRDRQDKRALLPMKLSAKGSHLINTWKCPFKEQFTQKMKNPFVITHPHVVSDLYGFLSSAQWKIRYFEERWATEKQDAFFCVAHMKVLRVSDAKQIVIFFGVNYSFKGHFWGFISSAGWITCSFLYCKKRLVDFTKKKLSKVIAL